VLLSRGKAAAIVQDCRGVPSLSKAPLARIRKKESRQGTHVRGTTDAPGRQRGLDDHPSQTWHITVSLPIERPAILEAFMRKRRAEFRSRPRADNGMEERSTRLRLPDRALWPRKLEAKDEIGHLSTAKK